MSKQNGSKVFGIGLSRTGTTSLNNALDDLGIPSSHFPKFDYIDGTITIDSEALCNFQGFTDTPIAAAFEQLDQQFVGSKFILTTRELESWLTSCEKFYGDKLFDQEPFRSLAMELFGTIGFDRDLFTVRYQQHLSKVEDYFSNRPQDLLIIDICSNDNGWDELCHFLGKPIPTTDFPHANRAAKPSTFLSSINWLKQWRSSGAQ